MDLPLDEELLTPESLAAWIRHLGIRLDLRELDALPARPLVFSEYRLEPPTIVIYRYQPLEEWLNLICQRHVGYYGPWYFLHAAYRLYFHLELNGLYEIERKWHHRCFHRLGTLEERAYRFTREILGTQHDPARFDREVEKGFQPG